MPTSPLARFGLALLGVAILAVSFVLGLVFLAVAVGLAILGGLGLTIRNWFLRRGSGKKTRDDGLVQAEYRVVRRERDSD